jgi:Domain of unknown function (DUF3387)
VKSKAGRNPIWWRAANSRGALRTRWRAITLTAVSAVELLNELIALAKEMQAARARGEELGLSGEEMAFYEALAENESAVQAMCDEKLRIIAHELLETLRKNATVDWAKRESARANMRVLVKRILKKYGYPPDLAEEAVQTALAQAEALLREVAIVGTLGISAAMNGFAFGSHADGLLIYRAAGLGLAVPALIYALTRVAATLWIET